MPDITATDSDSDSDESHCVERCPACNDLLWADAVHWCSARPVHHHDWENDPRHDLDQFGIRPEGGQWGKRGPPPGGPDAPDTRGPESESESESEDEKKKKQGEGKDKGNKEDSEQDGEQVKSQPEPEHEADDFEIEI
ncbi:hypothetical protein CcaverHIS631_0402540 [Cutaneotrichosporon cavernicola]|nr:hypothetical protein CcaverHIS631_0402540 [Cutaneotrichosporon cavernicola]